MDLNLLPVFHAVAEARSFSKAARRLGIPKSSVSRGIAALEAAVGAVLLRRTTRMVALTEAGAALKADTGPLLAQLERSLERAPGDRDPKGLLRLTASTDLGAVLMGAALPRFLARYPSLRVDLRLTNRVADLVAEGFDAAVRASARPLADSSLKARKLANTELQLFASPEYLRRSGTPQTFDELAAHDWVAFPRWKPPDALRKLPPPRLVGDDFLFIREALRAGGGIGALPVFLASHDARDGTLVRVLPQWSETRGMLSLVYQQQGNRAPRKVEVFRDFLLEWLAANPL
jgi:DNA-binding transcriptional LysR family regulator